MSAPLARALFVLLAFSLLACRDQEAAQQPATSSSISPAASSGPRIPVAPVKRGEGVGRVRASGSVQAAVQANIVAQANGRVTRVFVDAGSVVKKDDPLADLQATAPPALTIRAPIGGVVVSRAVDPGMSVAASLNAPPLFVIAEDLSRMRVIADIPEADIATIREKMPATASVDTLPGRSFFGRVFQLRRGPTTIKGSASHQMVVEFDNPDGALRPGMIANVAITTNGL